MKGFGWLKRVGKVVAKPVTVPAAAIKHGMEKTMTAAIMGIIRHVLTFGGGYLWAGEDLNAFVGAAATIIGLIWSLIEKRKTAR